MNTALLALVVCAAAAVPPPVARPPAARLAQLEKSLSEIVARSYGPGGTITTRHEPGPLDLSVVTAALEDAYPGSGVARLLVDTSGVSYGVHGDRDLADLVRARGWLVAGEPDAGTLVELVNVAHFEGVAMLLPTPAPRLERAGGALQLTFYRTWHPSGGKTRLQVRFGPSGKAVVTSTHED